MLAPVLARRTRSNVQRRGIFRETNKRHVVESPAFVPTKHKGHQGDSFEIVGFDHAVRDKTSEDGASIASVVKELSSTMLDIPDLDGILLAKGLDKFTKAQDAGILFREMAEVKSENFEDSL